MLNHIVIMGRLTRDPELRYTQSQIPVASFTLAVDRDYGRGEEKQTDFIDCVAWRQTGEFASKYFQKGSMAVVSGRLQIRDWTANDGTKRRSAEVVVDNLYFGESKRRDGGDNSRYERNDNYGSPRQSTGYGARQEQGYSAPGGGSAFSELDDGDSELPF